MHLKREFVSEPRYFRVPSNVQLKTTLILASPVSGLVAAVWAVAIATIYVLVTFDSAFLLGYGAFWANPVGPWLQDAGDISQNGDALNMLTGYRAFLHAGWHLPLFLVPGLGPAPGTNVILLDVIPIVALLGKTASILSGVAINPYGIWVAACFILSAVFATLLVREAGQKSLVAATAASILVMTATPLLHRFGHMGLMAHFLVIGALLLYLRDRRPDVRWGGAALWAGWLSLAGLVHPYLFVMCGAIYGASWLRKLFAGRSSLLMATAEPVIILAMFGCVAAIAGHFGPGSGTTAFAGGYGRFSMNLVSPFWPQRSGLLPGFDSIVDATTGQYEGFNYLGFGAILFMAIATILNASTLWRTLREHKWLVLVLAGLFVFALSDRIYFGDMKILDVEFSWRINHYLSMFRSSGRMFWPVYYSIILFSLVGVLRRLSPVTGSAVVLGCCLLQFVDTDPLRARLTRLTVNAVPTLIDHSRWEDRISRAAEVQIDPTFQCRTGVQHADAILELQLAAAVEGRPINSVYDSRFRESPEICHASVSAMRDGPWREDSLYVYLAGGPYGVPRGWMPQRGSCQTFELGVWCLGPPGAAR